MKQFFKKTRNKLGKYPTYVQFEKILDKVASRILAALLAFFDVVSPLLTFLCIKKPDTVTGADNGIM